MSAEKTFRVRCERLIRSLPIPRPFQTTTFLTEVAIQRGKHIELVLAPPTSGLPCGLLVSTAEVDYIVHRTDTTPLHAQHTDMHELGHLLLEHGRLRATQPIGAGELGLEGTAPVNNDLLHLLLPELSPRLIRRIFGRTAYGRREEWEAEVFASELMVAIHHPAGDRSHHAIDLADELARLPNTASPTAGQRWSH